MSFEKFLAHISNRLAVELGVPSIGKGGLYFRKRTTLEGGCLWDGFCIRSFEFVAMNWGLAPKRGEIHILHSRSTDRLDAGLSALGSAQWTDIRGL